jgi:hypothetical protein
VNQSLWNSYDISWQKEKQPLGNEKILVTVLNYINEKVLTIWKVPLQHPFKNL